ncbi:hypothetical protein [Xanthobacter sediminis]
MAVKLASVAVDIDREDSGGWEDSTAYPGVRYLVRGIRSKAFEDARDRVFQRLAKAYKTSPIPATVTKKEMGKLVAEHLLFGWDGFDEPYSADRATELLPDPAYRNMLDDVTAAAARVAERDVEFIEDLGKNSDSSSAIS